MSWFPNVVVMDRFRRLRPLSSRYADIRYTQGGSDQLEMAKTYYSHALKLNPNNMRALYGLLLVSNLAYNNFKMPL